MIGQVLLEGIGLGILLMLICAVGIRKGAVGMVHFYSPEVQARCVELGLTTQENISKRAKGFKLCCLPMYVMYLLVFAYAVNGAHGFWEGFWQMLVMLTVMNLMDRFLIDEYWVGHTKMWEIPGTEDLKPYITTKDKQRKWTFGILSTVLGAAVLSGIMMIFVH